MSKLPFLVAGVYTRCVFILLRLKHIDSEQCYGNIPWFNNPPISHEFTMKPSRITEVNPFVRRLKILKAIL